MNSILDKYVTDDGSDDTQWFQLVRLQVKAGERCRFARLDLQRDGFFVATTVDEPNWQYLEPFVRAFDRGDTVQLPVFKGRNGKWMFSQVTAARMLHGEIPPLVEEPTPPPLEEIRSHRYRIQAYFTREEREDLEEYARAHDLELHQLVRRVLMNLIEERNDGNA